MAQKAFKVKIYGMVQGVGFRYFTLQKAEEYGVTGYVKNLPDGSVEAYAEGSKDVLDLFLGDLKSGPRSAVVENIDVQWEEGAHKFNDFSVAY